MEQKHQPQCQRPKPRSRRRFGWALLFLSIVSVPWLVSGCNDYPLERLVARNYTEVTDVKSQGTSDAVDILFVVDNSGSMEEEQAKLKSVFSAFITELVSQDINDYQIGVITTDMADPSQQGRLQGSPKIINGRTLSKTVVVSAFQKNIIVGTTGTSYEKALGAMKAALSPEMIGKGKPNEGFLRPNSTLAVIFVGDEDDCTNNGQIKENEVDSEVCRKPNSEILKDFDGKPLLDNSGQPVRGQMENLISTSKYIEFLNKLNRTVVVSGIIGNPLVYKDAAKTKLVDPKTGCKKNIECFVGSAKHRCEFLDPKTTRCGGCEVTEKGTTLTVAPGFRLFDVIKKFGGKDQWFPICGKDKDFKQALLDFAGLIVKSIRFITLTRNPSGTESVLVQIVRPNQEPLKILQAQPTTISCTADAQCEASGKNRICGPDSKCYGDGWVLFPPTSSKSKSRLRLSGSAQDALQPGSKVKVVYVAKN